ncbi:MAG: macro domain-containing protein, partial [candidate division Zixibacteria bacterium]|nr:macro domain-containing protein [candidate division Zixibacteria bacterium]
RQATLSSIKLADELKINSIALPAFGTGVGDFPMKACANLMIKTSFGFQTLSNHLKLVQFCLYDKYGYSIFKEILERELLNR